MKKKHHIWFDFVFNLMETCIYFVSIHEDTYDMLKILNVQYGFVCSSLETHTHIKIYTQTTATVTIDLEYMFRLVFWEVKQAKTWISTVNIYSQLIRSDDNNFNKWEFLTITIIELEKLNFFHS